MNNSSHWKTIWQNPEQLPILDKNQVHVWRANLELSKTEIEQLATCLSTDEISRANKFRFPIHKRRFIVARGILRQLLGNYLQLSPDRIKFEYGDRGKPRLAASVVDGFLQFNVSHSEEYALYGFTHHHLIGVDLEYLRDMKDAVKLAERFFSPREFELLAAIDSEQQRKVFFKLWTAKEAYLKAIGTGLTNSLASIDISFDQTGNPKLLAIEGDLEATANWSMYPCVPEINYVATVAIKTPTNSQQIYFWNWHQNSFPPKI
ncbi:4'-phosphopantetheinyl transferase superfamily protein [Pleurocapsa sp. PCC 7319]|uniref:4'-phosphopantetheinyl transferase family protein n=1 Tax=Pleurocapsa sp. PCC 7319 TaxID=118161 RepID=UPI00034A55EA|nr:4'-phosphopantetheinyl transferase superfamily protein [Pleurocapsa sp. PCC 7319]